MFDEAYFLDVDFEFASNKAIELWNQGIKAGGLHMVDSFKFAFFEGAALFSAVMLSTHGSY